MPTHGARTGELQTSLKAAAYEAILDRLLKRELVPGELINRRAIAADLGMSPGPVLEAFLRLEADGFLETLPRKGTRVRLARPEDVVGNLIVREALECQAARLYFGEPVAGNAARLVELARAVDAACGRGAECWQAEIEFHRALVDLAGCGALTRAFRRVMRINLFYQLNSVNGPAQEKDLADHVALVKALKAAKGADEAEGIVREHVQTGKPTAVRRGATRA